MNFGLGRDALGLLAGVLSTLSPCVLPLIPIVVAGAASAHRRGLMALAGGLVASFAVLGTAIAYAASAFDVDPRTYRMVAAVVLGLFGLVLLSGSLQRRYATATAGVGDWGQRMLARLEPAGLGGQFLVGVMLGVIWSPCVGPTLGAAIGLASQGKDLPSIAVVMAAFGIGATIPLIAVGLLSRRLVAHTRDHLLFGGRIGKAALGLVLMLTAVAMLTGLDQRAEGWLVNHEPARLMQLTSRY